MKDKLNQRSKQFSLVLNDSGADVFKDSRHIITAIRCCGVLSIHFVACIKHDKDIDEDTQHVKTPHYHLVISLYQTTRIGTMINLLVDIFKCNANQISIEKCTDLIMATRYLIHLDDFEKVKYHADDVCTNDNELLTNYLEHVNTIKDIKDLITIVHQFPNLCDLMVHIGYDNYKKYRLVINDIRREYQAKY